MRTSPQSQAYGGYPPPQGGYGYQEGGYPPPHQQGGYPQQPGGYPPPQGGPQGYPPPQGGYPTGPAAQGPPPDIKNIGQYKGNVPDQDVMDDPHAKEPSAPLPPANLVDPVPGYGTGFEYAPCSPPPNYEEVVESGQHQKDVKRPKEITEQQAQDALKDFAASHCCYRKTPALEMKITELRPSSAFHYKLESYVENRSTKWKIEGYIGQSFSASTGPPPMPWDIQVQPPEMFKKGEQKMEVPGTVTVKMCHGCSGWGFERCWKCMGRGMLMCTSCRGMGRTFQFQEHRECNWCHGMGRRECQHCWGRGQKHCRVCNGHRNIKCYVELKVQWEVKKDEHVSESGSLPPDLVKSVHGATAVKESYPRVIPVTYFPERAICDASTKYVTEHANKYGTNSRIIMQNQEINIVPVTQVLYTWKGESYSYFVYGDEMKVYDPDYPSKCCCSIL